MLILFLGLNLIFQFFGILQYQKSKLQLEKRRPLYMYPKSWIQEQRELKKRAFLTAIFGVFAILYFQIKDLTDDK